MRVLIVKTSSLGDVIHTLPALTDAGCIYPDIRFDWVIEENFSEIPAWHPLVDKIIPMAWRRWRKNLFQLKTYREMKRFYQQLRSQSYDYVIDAQGLVKSGIITRFTRGLRCGLDRQSAWEPIANLAYQRHCAVNPDQHAVTRMRQLFAAALGYPAPDSAADYNIHIEAASDKKSIVFLHGTTWTTKLWPDEYWIQLAQLAVKQNYKIVLPWGNVVEKQRAEHIASVVSSPLITVLPPLNLANIGQVLMQAAAIVAVDTGLGHLAAAFEIPTISLYGPTSARLTGTEGTNQYHLQADFPACAPCLQRQCTYTGLAAAQPACLGSLTPEKVWNQLQGLLS